MRAGPQEGETDAEWQKRLVQEMRAAEAENAEAYPPGRRRRLNPRRPPTEGAKKRFTERNVEIVRLRDAGMTYTSIGKKFGIGRERARQINLRFKRLEKRRAAHSQVVSAFKPTLTRPIDMGGPRDVWQVWTPEMQAREFGLL